jgi:hypothetical protein
VVQHFWAAKSNELCEFKTCYIEMMKPQLTAHCPCITKIGKRAGREVVNNFYSVAIGK